MPGPGFHLNPFEQNAMQALIAGLSHPGTADVALQLGMPMIQGAEQRRATNVSTRDQGIQALQQQAMQLAAQGATRQAIQQATSSQAQDLPLMGGGQGQNALGDLHQFVGGLDWQQATDPTTGQSMGAISGLMPADARAQFQAAVPGLTPENKAAISTIVIQHLRGDPTQGIAGGDPLVNIREAARQYAISSGGTEADVNEAVQVAEQAYTQATGMDPATMRSMGDQLRSIQTSNPDWLQGLPGLQGMDPSTFNPQAYLGQQAAVPGGLSSLASTVGTYQPPAPHGFWDFLPFVG